MLQKCHNYNFIKQRERAWLEDNSFNDLCLPHENKLPGAVSLIASVRATR